MNFRKTGGNASIIIAKIEFEQLNWFNNIKSGIFIINIRRLSFNWRIKINNWITKSNELNVGKLELKVVFFVAIIKRLAEEKGELHKQFE